MSRSSLRGTSSFARLLRSRSDFTSCRVERLPSRTFVFDLPHPFRHGFEAFPAVYRAPSLFWHLLVMNSQQFTDTPSSMNAADLFATPFPVSLTAGLSLLPMGYPRKSTICGGGSFNHADAYGAETFRFTVSFLRARRFFPSCGLATTST